MPLTIAPDSPLNPAARRLLEAAHAFSASLYPPEENFVLSIEDMAAPGILFFTARDGDTPVGTVALVLHRDYAEVKSMFVAPEARGKGAAALLLARVAGEARSRCLGWLRLETGPRNTEALKLYAREGFSRCGVFGDYADIPASIFMERRLDPPQPRRMHADEDMAPVHALLTAAFAYMEGVIDPPSSMNRITLADLSRDAAVNELWVIEPGPAACMILTPKPGTLYLGKLAVAESHRGAGLARVMIEHAMVRGRALGLPSVTLQTRVELAANHAAFRRLGFTEVERTAHEGYNRPTSITFRRDV